MLQIVEFDEKTMIIDIMMHFQVTFLERKKLAGLKI